MGDIKLFRLDKSGVNELRKIPALTEAVVPTA
jgi:hypothetical protein